MLGADFLGGKRRRACATERRTARPSWRAPQVHRTQRSELPPRRGKEAHRGDEAPTKGQRSASAEERAEAAQERSAAAAAAAVEKVELVVMGDWESILDAQTVEAERVAKAVAQAEPAETLEAVTAALEAATAMVEARVLAAMRHRSDWLDSLEDTTDVAEEAVGPPTSASGGGGR